MKNPRRKRTGYLFAKSNNSYNFLVTPHSGGVLDPKWNKVSVAAIIFNA